MVYIDNSILLSQYKEKIQYEIKSLQEIFDLTEDGELKDHLGNIFEINKKYGSIALTQPRMVEIFIELVGLNSTSEISKCITPLYVLIIS